MEANGLPTPDNVIFGEIQVLLAEKRTALASRISPSAFAHLPVQSFWKRGSLRNGSQSGLT